MRICWCIYCKEEIRDTDDLVVKKGKTYHLDCWKLNNTYIDEFGDNLEEE